MHHLPRSRKYPPAELRFSRCAWTSLTAETTFPGPGSDAINNNCLVCHSAGMVLNQPALPKAAWQAEVDKMIHVYKAPVAPEDVAAIVDYLAKIKGVD